MRAARNTGPRLAAAAQNAGMFLNCETAALKIHYRMNAIRR